MRTILIITLFASIFTGQIFAQFSNPEPAYLFDDEHVARIDILIADEDLQSILDPSNVNSNEEFSADFYYEKDGQLDTMLNVGFRLRGNTSRNAAKKSFKVSFNSFEKGRKFYGVEKLNLNGEHNDPTITRSKICWDIFAMADVPCSRSSHTRLYINGEYRGLYINVEHIDEEFIQKRFYQSHGNLYKCLWPADLHYQGQNPNNYKEAPFGRRTYDLKTNREEDDYSDLAHFIDVLNNTPTNAFPCEIEKVFDVDNYLKVIAIDQLIANWDGPIVNKNNFYLYFNPSDQRFSYIPYDLDNTYGIDWFGVDWANTSIYNWSALSGDYRPIYERILSIPAYQKRLSFYMDKFTQAYFNEEFMDAYILEKKAQLYPYRLNDFYANDDYNWSVQNFLDNFDEPVGLHVKYGLKDYAMERAESVYSQLKNIEESAFISKANIYRRNHQIEFDIFLENADQLIAAEFQYSINSGNYEFLQLNFNNGHAQFIFPVTEAGTMEYKIFLTSISSQTFWPLCGEKEIQLGASPTPNLVINELMSFNTGTASDESGEYEDWIELFNADNLTLNLEDYFLSDKEGNPDKWKMPYYQINPGEYVIIWADEDEPQGNLHSNFKLNREGEFLGIFSNSENDYEMVDGVYFPELNENQSYGRLPNGTGSFTVLPSVSFAENNETTSTQDLSEQISIFPNPTTESIYYKGSNNINIQSLKIIDDQGRMVLEANEFPLNLKKLNSGVYTLLLQSDKRTSHHKLIKI